MSYNLKCCSFYPNNFDASALRTDRSTHAHRPKYTCTPTEVHTYTDRSTHAHRPKRDDNKLI